MNESRVTRENYHIRAETHTGDQETSCAVPLSETLLFHLSTHHTVLHPHYSYNQSTINKPTAHDIQATQCHAHPSLSLASDSLKSSAKGFSSPPSDPAAVPLLPDVCCSVPAGSFLTLSPLPSFLHELLSFRCLLLAPLLPTSALCCSTAVHQDTQHNSPSILTNTF